MRLEQVAGFGIAVLQRALDDRGRLHVNDIGQRAWLAARCMSLLPRP